MRRKGSTVMEWVLLVACVAWALWFVQVLMKRSIQGSYKATADSFGHGAVYDGRDE